MLARSLGPRRKCTLHLSYHVSRGSTARCLTIMRQELLRPWSRKALSSPATFERNLATAWGEIRPNEDLADIPFEQLPPSLTPIYPSSDRWKPCDLRPFDPAAPLMIAEPPPAFPRTRINIYGVPGDVEELYAVFRACIRVGKLDRAGLAIQRFARLGILTGQELVTLHNQFLRANLARIQGDPSHEKADNMHRWYELEIRNRFLPNTPETMAFMLKASLLTSDGKRRTRLVKRYMDMLPEQAGLGEVFEGSDVLTDQDISIISQICPHMDLQFDRSLDEDAGFEAADPTPGPTVAESASPVRGQPSTSPEVLSTPQKGLGLKALKQTLSLFTRTPVGFDIAALSPADRRELQAKLEYDCVDAAIDRWREESQSLRKMGLNPAISGKKMGENLHNWHTALEKRIKEELELVVAAESLRPQGPGGGGMPEHDLERCQYGPFLQLSDPGRLAAVTLLSVLGLISMSGTDAQATLARVVVVVAKAAEEDVRAQLRVKRERELQRVKESKAKARRLHAQQQSPEASRAAQLPLPSVLEALDRKTEAYWPVTIRTKVGGALVAMLLETARLDVRGDDPVTKEPWIQNQAAFIHSFTYKRGKKVGVLWLNPAVVEQLKQEPRGEYLARHLPMVCEPEPWSGFEKGGFLTCPTALVRMRQPETAQKIYAEAAIERGDMDQMFKGLDVLGKTAWRINRPVFRVMLAAWNTGEAVANIPPLDPKVNIPPEPPAHADPFEKAIWYKDVKQEMNRKQGLHSVRCFMNFQLEIARAFLDQTFYFPHNIDFRGRAYPLPSYLNHMGADHVRGLMCFAEGKALGERGLRWLKVHLANVYGYDKASLKDRERFAHGNLAEIYDSCEKPLSGKKWWINAEDPWQCLATCFELKAALDSPDPTQYVSHMPVHQDGTCNGLQHYAALGGDRWGAQQVNLEPGDRPADVYSAVADLVNENITKDAEAGPKLARALLGKVTRKVVKQTVMTNVYGVTFMGAKNQVLKQIKDLYPDLTAQSGCPLGLLAHYIAIKIFEAMSTMFHGAHDIQAWLGEVGGRVCRALTAEQIAKLESNAALAQAKAVKKMARGNKETEADTTKMTKDDSLVQFRSTIVWTTPLRMPVVQPYRKSTTRAIQTSLQTLALTDLTHADPVDQRKQLQAFPPNFIHSLDASHMMLTALKCNEGGLAFASVHDSFWTHAADIDTMNTLIRDCFIRIHSEDVIGRLAKECEARYRGAMYLAKVDRGSEVAKQIGTLRRHLRLSQKNELLLEKRRLDLLNSSDPAEVEEGKRMVTPGSVFDEAARAASVDDLIEREDLGGTALGKISAAPALDAVKEDCLEDETAMDEATAIPNLETEAPDLSLSDKSFFGHEMERTEARLKRSGPKKKAVITVWQPLTFPPIPKKGDYDVRRLRESKYFFS